MTNRTEAITAAVDAAAAHEPAGDGTAFPIEGWDLVVRTVPSGLTIEKAGFKPLAVALAPTAFERLLNREALAFHQGYTIEQQDKDIAIVRTALGEKDCS